MTGRLTTDEKNRTNIPNEGNMDQDFQRSQNEGYGGTSNLNSGDAPKGQADWQGERDYLDRDQINSTQHKDPQDVRLSESDSQTYRK